jgi:DNA replication protein DnaC
MKADDDAMHERLRQNQIEQRRMICFGSSDLIRATFADDDCKDPRLTETCKAFSERVAGDSSRDWLLLWGDCGTGKSFMAACIANAAIDAGMTARFITVPEIEQQLWNADRATVYDEFNHVDLLIIDDFGCERRTDYMDEIKFNLIDGRLRSGKPCVITSNLTLGDFAAPADLTQKRIISRILERAKTFHVLGDDRRFAAFKSRAEQSSSRETEGECE